ncbi:MoaD/ThiS family protein [Candidatus Palauibacter sp.]|uniref:MoaD/ThiS family protein n=1 Tax=Candidatus Palauibacter sp. TaxID=3101350 RepID=UPI003AF2DE64
MTGRISVRTLFFGVYGELAARREGSAELATDSTVEDLVRALRGPGGLDWLPERVVVAVNQRYAESGTRLANGDEVALIPPVAGG